MQYCFFLSLHSFEVPVTVTFGEGSEPVGKLHVLKMRLLVVWTCQRTEESFCIFPGSLLELEKKSLIFK